MTPAQWVSIISDVATTAAVLVAAAGLLYTGKQLELSRKATAAQLLLQVDEALREFDETIYGLRDGSLRGDEFEVQRLMGAMERLHVLVSKRLVDADEVEDLHGWRLVALLGNEKVRAYVNQYSYEWRRLTELDQRLAVHRAHAAQRVNEATRNH